MSRWSLHRGDCREFLRALPGNSADAAVTDPPYELNFMGREWDRTGIAFDPAFWAEVLRVLKPGAHLLAAGIGRTHHRMMAAVEDAGFEIRDCICHIFGSGFPKNLDVSKEIDRRAGAERPVVGRHAPPEGREWNLRQADDQSAPGSGGMFAASGCRTLTVTAPATEEAARWQGGGTALRPAVEIWVLARKPLSERTVAENVLRWGTGALNVDGCRVPYRGRTDPRTFGGAWRTDKAGSNVYSGGWQGEPQKVSPLGRWPANLALSHTEECAFKGYRRVRGSGTSKSFHGPYEGVSATGFLRGWSHPGNQHAGPDGTEVVEDWECAPGCPVRLLDAQAGELKSGFMRAGTLRRNLCGYRGAMPAETLRDTYGDSGGASRFFYCAKVSRDERWAWCRTCGRAASPEELEAHRAAGHEMAIHPTQKPLELMRWLVRLVAPPGGLVIDPFAGSGTTLVAALLEGFRCAGAERDPEYAGIAEARLRAAAEGSRPPLRLEGPGGAAAEQPTLF